MTILAITTQRITSNKGFDEFDSLFETEDIEEIISENMVSNLKDDSNELLNVQISSGTKAGHEEQEIENLFAGKYNPKD